jgi:glutathione synthase/RimK-type ligase-like ATP-grasp enzyme
MAPPAVLVAWSSTRDDPGVERVRAALGARGARVVDFDSAVYPGPGLRLSYGPARPPVLHTAAGDEPLDALEAVWVRHLRTGTGLSDAVVHPSFQTAVRAQAGLAVWDLLERLPCRMIDRPSALQAVPDPMNLLRMAAACGLAIPDTLATSCPEAAAAFLDAHPGGVITKLLHSSATQVLTPRGYEYVPTRSVRPEDRARLPRLALCPMVFQEEVPKEREYRVTVVGAQVFTASVDPRGSARGAVDWRQDPALVGAFQPDRLDPEVEAALLALLDRFGLQFATADFIRRPDGQTVFLEINTISFFDFIEDAAGLPISEAIADALLGQAPLRGLAGRWP